MPYLTVADAKWLKYRQWPNLKTMIKLIEVSPNTWVFRHNLPEGAEDSFDDAVELYESGNLVEAEETLRKLLFVCPHYIYALHHLALIFSEDGLELESYLCWREAVRIGLEAIPSNFSWHTSHMNWLELDNRPFMRAYHALGLSLLENRGLLRPSKSLPVLYP